MKSLLKTLLFEDDGTTSVEYCLMLALILMSVIGAISAFGQGQSAYWGKIDGEMKSHGL